MAVALQQLAFSEQAIQPQEPKPSTPEYWVLGLLRPGHPDLPPALWTRSRLAYQAAICDRDVRLAIANLIAMGWPIVSDSGHAGYSLATDPDQLAPAIRESASREVAMRDRRIALERAQRALAARTLG